jgi:hypothetical protein
MVYRVQVAAEPERCTVRLAERLTAAQLDERLRAWASRRLPWLSPLSFRSTPRWFTPRLAAGGAELVAAVAYLGHMTGPM